MKGMKRLFVSISLLTVSLLGMTAFAESPTPSPSLPSSPPPPPPPMLRKGACTDDIQKLCSGVTAGGGAVATCLKRNEAQVSPTCKEHMSRMTEKMKAMKEKFRTAREACQGDVDKYCKEVSRAKGGRITCLRANMNQPDFSPACKMEIEKLDNPPPPGPRTSN